MENDVPATLGTSDDDNSPVWSMYILNGGLDLDLSQVTKQGLCLHCRSLRLDFSPLESKEHRYYLHHGPGSSLRESARYGCPFCMFIWKQMDIEKRISATSRFRILISRSKPWESVTGTVSIDSPLGIQIEELRIELAHFHVDLHPFSARSVQDDSTDWAAEAALMSKIYRNARCTFSASLSCTSSTGLFRKYDTEYDSVEIELLDENEVPVPVHLLRGRERWYAAMDRSPLQRHLTRSLLWVPNSIANPGRHDDYIAPSWSWASISGEAFFHYPNLRVDLARPGLATITRYHIELSTPDPYGSVDSASLHLRTPIPVGYPHRLTIDPGLLKSLPPLKRGPFKIMTDEHSAESFGTIFFDIEAEAHQILTVKCIALGENYDMHKVNRGVGLAIVQEGDSGNMYRRVGYLEDFDMKFFEEAEVEDIIII
ncbi:hypothetical protein OPT61_g8817 [Boeremia exigua]|uniref:Uncharacterized protein n=1 Tax=Boeremia exigua TaxID=749465 RepID=A0ACC2HYB8_9PLEO|nr:hypothetical protein OPT61_g8817 [Boeremia exigua]